MPLGDFEVHCKGCRCHNPYGSSYGEAECEVRYPVPKELIEAARAAGEPGVKIRYHRAVISPGMSRQMRCPWPRWDADDAEDSLTCSSL